MIELYSLMWVIAAFTAILGFQRGWNREVIVTTGCVLGMFLLFQLDALLRGTLLASTSREQTFFIQAGIFLLIVYAAYQNPLGDNGNDERGNTSNILGGIMGFVNGYLIGGSLWYFLDINEYPLAPLIIAPSLNSPSAISLQTMPMVVLSGGVGGNGDFLIIAVIGLLLLVILSIGS